MLQPLVKSSAAYESMGLKFNPFPLMPTPVMARFVSGADRKEKIQIITRQIMRVKSGDSITMGIMGDYGLGKSHLLRHIEYKLSEEPEMRPNENLALYIKRPYDPRRKCDLCYLCALICERLDSVVNEDFLPYIAQKLYAQVAIGLLEARQLKKLARDGFGDRVVGLVRRYGSDQHCKELIDYIKDDYRALYDREGEIDFARLREAVIEDVSKHLEMKDTDASNYVDGFFLRETLDMFFENRRQRAWRRISSQFSTTNEEARKFLKTIINLSRYVGYRTFVILLDEIDQIPEQELHTLLGELTLFLEESGDKGPPPHLLFILSYTPKLGLLTSFYERRLALQMGLERMSREDTIEMVTDYLNRARPASQSLEPFDEESIESIWHARRGGDVGDMLKSCFWVVECLAEGMDLKQAMDMALKNTDMPSPTNAVMASVGLLRPMELDREKLLALYDSMDIASERSKIVEDASRILCRLLTNHPVESSVITSVASTRQRMDTNGGKRKSREVDVFLTLERDGGSEMRLALEIKAHRRNAQEYVSVPELEGPLELLERGIIDRLIIITVTDLDIRASNRIREFNGAVAVCRLEADNLSQLLYCTDKYYYGRKLRSEEALQVAQDIGLLPLFASFHVDNGYRRR
ncbi:MAG: hypothetical protein SVY53_00005 [Chloroflexota bacterium]|nr:hypothetical protein [Chloroflexota bacterium]